MCGQGQSSGNFNLLTEPWIPVLYRDGRFAKVGIQKALDEAGDIRQIAASNPMDRVALLRFLLAVRCWCHGDLRVLEQHHCDFNLLGGGRRFYQDAALRGGTGRPIADLLVEFPGADSVNHMRHVVHDGSWGFCPACCALGVLRLSVWAPANRYYPASVNPATAAYAVVDGGSLLSTLDANLVEETARSDQAAWLSDAPPDPLDAGACLAWRPRRLWLNVADEQGICANCGIFSLLITTLCNEAGWPTPATDGQKFAKTVEVAFKRLGYDAKGKDQASRIIKKVVKNAWLIRMCRMDELRRAYGACDPPLAATAQSPEKDARDITRMFRELVRRGDWNAIQAPVGKATPDEQNRLGDAGATKKFWDGDPHLLREGEPISLPALSSDVGSHASRLWRDALRLRPSRTGKVEAIGPVVNKFTFQDATSVSLPGASAQERARKSEDCRDRLRDLLIQAAGDCRGEARGTSKRGTPAAGLSRPEVRAAFALLTPDTEARVLAVLKEPGAATNDAEFLLGIYETLVELVVSSTTPGSPLRRREAVQLVQRRFRTALRKLAQSEKRGGT